MGRENVTTAAKAPKPARPAVFRRLEILLKARERPLVPIIDFDGLRDLWPVKGVVGARKKGFALCRGRGWA